MGRRARSGGLARLRRAGRRIQRRALILLYHRVAEPPWDPAGLCVAPGRFAEQLAMLRRRFEPVPLRSLLAGPARWSRRRPPVALTFDDGYADNLHEALPLLERFEVPATVFAVSGALGGERELWWDELERACGAAPVDERLRLYRGRHARLRGLPEPERRKALDGWLAETNGDGAVRESHRLLTPAELRRLGASPLVEIGAHTATHPVLATLPPEAQAAEIGRGRARLEEILERPVRSFAYPFGEAGDFDAETVRQVEAAGFELACTTRRGALRAGTSPFLWPRCSVPDWDADKLARRLWRWSAD